jgi:1-acyl-sn-glycerol-3-phosphate acyltransferase
MESELSELRRQVEELNSSSLTENHDRIQVYSDLELLRLRVEQDALTTTSTSAEAPSEGPESKGAKVLSAEQKEKLIAEIEELGNSLRLRYVKRKNWYDLIDKVVCGTACWVWLITACIIFAAPAMAIKKIEAVLIKKGILSPKHQVTLLIRKLIGHGCLVLGGMALTPFESCEQGFESECPLVCFSHGSAMDTFILGAVIPVHSFTLAKKEMFLIPFLSLTMFAFGGIPIDRGNRSAAMQSLQKAIKSAKSGGCVMIAPEGTRSKSGQLKEFKKGPFYVWDDLQTPIVPLLIVGAYDLCPPGHFMSLPGKIFYRFLPPLEGTRASGMTRESVSRELRRRMLEGLKTFPRDAAQSLSWYERSCTVAAQISLVLLLVWLYKGPAQWFMRILNITFAQLLGAIVVCQVIVTLCLYITQVVMNKARGEKSGAKEKDA